MKSWVPILISIDTSNDNENQDVESIIADGAAAQGYSCVEIGINDASGAEIAFKLVKQ